jgi:hypothetical protein
MSADVNAGPSPSRVKKSPQKSVGQALFPSADDPAADIVDLGALQCNNATLLAYSPLQIVFATGAIRLALSRALNDPVATPLA